MLHTKKNIPVCLWDTQLSLGEGVVWVEAEQNIYFVDILGKKLCCYSPDTEQKKLWNTPRYPVFVFPTNRKNILLCGMDDGLYWFNTVGQNFTKWLELNDGHVNNRLNDGYIDSLGRLWMGTMDWDEKDVTGSLYYLSWDEYQPKLIQKDEGYVVTNGPFISDKNRKLYHNHSNEQIIYAFDIDLEKANLWNKSIFSKLEQGYPDGMALDIQDNLWVCLYKGYCVYQYSSSGVVIDKITLPCPNITKIAFGGKERKTAFVSTAQKGMTEQELSLYPRAGGLFSFEVDIPGQPQHIFQIPEYYK